MKKNGFTLTELLAVIVILGILVGIAIPVYYNTSSNVKENEYQSKKEYIKVKAENYAEDNNFDNSVTTIVSTLIASGYITADKYVKQDSNEIPFITNPIDPDDNLACHIVNISLENYEYHAEVSDESNCDLVTQEVVDEKMGIKAYKFTDNKITGELGYENAAFEWSEANVMVVVNPQYENIDSIKITANGSTKEVVQDNMLNNVYNGLTVASTYSNTALFSAQSILESPITVTVQSEGTVKASTVKIRIDKEEPIIKTENFSGWTSSDKATVVYISDGNGSGPNGVYLTTVNNKSAINETEFYTSNSAGTAAITRTLNNGKYYLWAKDNVGNISSTSYEFIVQNVDNIKPQCIITGENKTWTNKPVTITWGCTDSESGCDENNKGGVTVFQPKTTKTAVIEEYKIKDNVGNEETCSTGGTTVDVYFDITPPTITAKQNPLNRDRSNYILINNVTYYDNDSGIKSASCTPASTSEYGNTGIYNVTCTAVDNAGNSASVTFTVRHQYPATKISQTCSREVQYNPHECNWCPCGYELKLVQSDCGGSGCFTMSTKWAYECKCREEHGTCYDKKTETYDCSYYTCPQGGSLSGSTCKY